MEHGDSAGPPQGNSCPDLPGEVRIEVDSVAELARQLQKDAENLAAKVGYAQMMMTRDTEDFHGKAFGAHEGNPRARQIAGYNDSISTHSVSFNDVAYQDAEYRGMKVAYSSDAARRVDAELDEVITNAEDLMRNNRRGRDSKTDGTEST